MMFGRWIEPVLRTRFRAPYVHLVFGARQTGKSTLLRRLLPHAAVWLDFSNPGERAEHLREPDRLVQRCRALPRTRTPVVVIDEAHKCSARTGSGGAGREPRVVTTKRYELASKLAAQCDSLLLLTATPHHGDEDKFAHFLRLIDPDLFPEPHRLGQEAAAVRKDVFRLGADCPWAPPDRTTLPTSTTTPHTSGRIPIIVNLLRNASHWRQRLPCNVSGT